MRFIFSFSILFLINSCNDTPQKVTTDTIPVPQVEIIDTIFNNGYVLTDTTTVPFQRVEIGTSGIFINLPNTHKIDEQKGSDFMVYYFTPVDTSVYHGEGGIYFGPKPDRHPPTKAYTEKTITGTFLGVKTKWTEYTTADYTQTETFIENGGDQKIHVWFYANNPEEMARLLKMVMTISKTK